MTYRPRILEKELDERLTSAGAVVLEGPKACGKTETARQRAASEALLDVDERMRAAVAVDPKLILEGETPRLIDEWQTEPAIWNHIRRCVDDRGLPGQFILTGSAVPADDVTRHSGAGRLTRLRMRPMSLAESGHSTGAISLATLLSGKPARSVDPGLTVNDLATRICLGGWPGSLAFSERGALRAVRNYLEEVEHVDIHHVDGIRRDPAKVGRLFQSLARNVATYASATTLAADTAEADEALSIDTVRDYLTALERLMVVEDQPPWSPRLRSRARLRRSSKRHFVDPSIAVAALRATPERLLEDVPFMGFLFESLVTRDLRIYAQANDAEILQYRDSTGLEVDAIVEAHDGRWGAVEIKLGPSMVDQAAESLLTFASRVATRTPPAFLAVVTGFGYGYQREDGVLVVPLGALGA